MDIMNAPETPFSIQMVPQKHHPHNAWEGPWKVEKGVEDSFLQVFSGIVFWGTGLINPNTTFHS